MGKSLTLVSMRVLGEDGAAVGNEVKGESNITSRSVKGVSLITFNSKGREDSQFSWSLSVQTIRRWVREHK